MTSLGVQWTADLYGCDRALLDDRAQIGAFMLEAARVAGATILSSQFHTFAPQGVSGVVIISESHLAIHTWPELGYAAVDLFTCGDRLRAEDGLRCLAERLGATEVVCVPHVRGDPRRISALGRRAEDSSIGEVRNETLCLGSSDQPLVETTKDYIVLKPSIPNRRG